MIQPAQIPGLLLDPRGRMNRGQLLLAAAVMLAVEIGLLAALRPDGSLPAVVWPLKALSLWVGGVAIVKRLHDVGLSGWWLPAGAAGMCMWAAVLGVALALTGGLDALRPGGLGYLLLLAALMIPALGATLWLHFAAGEPGMNRFGAPPATPAAGEKIDTAGAARGR
jgi:uncharacterized membrane protein YhaH (DUF805 family)